MGSSVLIRRITDARDLVFVFGSNLAGRHGKGAAEFARLHLGAQSGVGEGLQGLSWALPTKDENLQALSLERIGEGLERLGAFALKNPSMRFQLTRVGCGLAGYTDEQLVQTLLSCPTLMKAKNVTLPGLWRERLDESLAILAVVGCRYERRVSAVFEQIHKRIDALRKSGKTNIVLASGGAMGVDNLAYEFAIQNGYRMTVIEANWDKFKLRAGPFRNRTLAWYSTHVLAMPSAKSKGTLDMIATSKKEGLDVRVINLQ